MFSQEVLRRIATGVGTEVSTLLEGIDLQTKVQGTAQLSSQRLRDAFMPREAKNKWENSVWNRSYCVADKMITERIARALIRSATKALPDQVEWLLTRRLIRCKKSLLQSFPANGATEVSL